MNPLKILLRKYLFQCAWWMDATELNGFFSSIIHNIFYNDLISFNFCCCTQVSEIQIQMRGFFCNLGHSDKFLIQILTTNHSLGLHQVNADFLDQRLNSDINTLCFNHSVQMGKAHLLLMLSQFATGICIKASN